jgi:hypothetical protein
MACSQKIKIDLSAPSLKQFHSVPFSAPLRLCEKNNLLICRQDSLPAESLQGI